MSAKKPINLSDDDDDDDDDGEDLQVIVHKNSPTDTEREYDDSEDDDDEIQILNEITEITGPVAEKSSVTESIDSEITNIQLEDIVAEKSSIAELVDDGITIIRLEDTEVFLPILSDFFKDAPDSPENVQQRGLAGVSRDEPMNLRNDGRLASMSSIFGPTRAVHSHIIEYLADFHSELMEMLDRKYIRHIPGPLYVTPTGMAGPIDKDTWSQSFFPDSSDTQFEAFLVLQGEYHVEYIPNSKITTFNFPLWIPEEIATSDMEKKVTKERENKVHKNIIVSNPEDTLVKVAMPGDIVIKYTHLKTKVLHPNPTKTTVIKQFYGFVLSNEIRSMDSVIFKKLLTRYDMYPNPENGKFGNIAFPYTPFGLLNQQMDSGRKSIANVEAMEALSKKFHEDFTSSPMVDLLFYTLLRKTTQPNDMVKSDRKVQYKRLSKAEILSMLYGKTEEEKMGELRFWSKPIYDRLTSNKVPPSIEPKKPKPSVKKPVSAPFPIISSNQELLHEPNIPDTDANTSLWSKSVFDRLTSMPSSSAPKNPKSSVKKPVPPITSAQDQSYKTNMNDLISEGITVVDVVDSKKILHKFNKFFKNAPDSPDNVKESGFAGVTANQPMTLRSDGRLTSVSSIYGPSRSLHAKLATQLIELQTLMKDEMTAIGNREGKKKPAPVEHVRNIPGPLYVCPPGVVDNSIKKDEWTRSFFPDSSHMQFEAYMVLQGEVMVEYAPGSQMGAAEFPSLKGKSTMSEADVRQIVPVPSGPTKIITVQPGQIVIKYTHLVTSTLPPNDSNVTVIKQFYGFVLSRTDNSMHLKNLQKMIRRYDNYPSPETHIFEPKGKTFIPETPFGRPNTQWENDPDSDTAQAMETKSSKFPPQYRQKIVVDGKEYDILKKNTRPDDILSLSNGEVQYREMAPREFMRMVYGLTDDAKMDKIKSYSEPTWKRLTEHIHKKRDGQNESKKRRLVDSPDRPPSEDIALPPKTKKPKKNTVEAKDVVLPPSQPKKVADVAGPPVFEPKVQDKTGFNLDDEDAEEIENALGQLDKEQAVEQLQNKIYDTKDFTFGENDNGKDVLELLAQNTNMNLKVTLRFTSKGNSVYATQPIFEGQTVALLKLKVYVKTEQEGGYVEHFYDQRIPKRKGESFMGSLYGSRSAKSIPQPTDTNVPYWGFFVNRPFGKSKVADGTNDEKANVRLVFDRNKNYEQILNEKGRKRIEPGDMLTYRFVAISKIEPETEILWSRHIMDLEPAHPIPPRLMDWKAINALDVDKKLKVKLKYSDTKHVSIFATKEIKRGEYVAHYKVKIYENKLHEYGEYEVAITLSDNSSLDEETFGDIFEGSLDPTGDDNVPYYGYFANEPTFGVIGERENVKFGPHETLTKYDGVDRNVTVGKTIIMSLKAIRNIKPGQEIMWVYGDKIDRGYTPVQAIPSIMIERDSMIEDYSVPEADKEDLVGKANELLENGIVVIPYLKFSKRIKDDAPASPEKYIIKLLEKELAKSKDTPDYFRELRPGHSEKVYGFDAIDKEHPLTVNAEGIMGTFSSVYNPITRDLHSQIASEFLTQFFYHLVEKTRKIYIRHITPTLEVPVVSSPYIDGDEDTYFGSIQDDSARHQYIMILPLTEGQQFRYIKKSKLDHTQYKEFFDLKFNLDHPDYEEAEFIGDANTKVPKTFIRDHEYDNATDEYDEITIPAGHLLIFQSHLLHTKIIDMITEKMPYAIRLVSGFTISGGESSVDKSIILQMQKSLLGMTMPRFPSADYMQMRPKITRANIEKITHHSDHYDDSIKENMKNKSLRIIPISSPLFTDLYPPISKQELGRTAYSYFSVKLYKDFNDIQTKRQEQQKVEYTEKLKKIQETSGTYKKTSAGDDIDYIDRRIKTHIDEYYNVNFLRFPIMTDTELTKEFETAKKTHKEKIIDKIIFIQAKKEISGGIMKLIPASREKVLLNFADDQLEVVVSHLRINLEIAHANELKTFVTRFEYYEDLGRHLRVYIPMKAKELKTIDRQLEKKTSSGTGVSIDQLRARRTTIKEKLAEWNTRYDVTLALEKKILSDGRVAQILDKGRSIDKEKTKLKELENQLPNLEGKYLKEKEQQIQEKRKKLEIMETNHNARAYDNPIFTAVYTITILLRLLKRKQDKANEVDLQYIVDLDPTDPDYVKVRKYISNQFKEITEMKNDLSKKDRESKRIVKKNTREIRQAKNLKKELVAYTLEYNEYKKILSAEKPSDFLENAIEYLDKLEAQNVADDLLEPVNKTVPAEVIESFDDKDKAKRSKETRLKTEIYFYPLYIKWIKKLIVERNSKEKERAIPQELDIDEIEEEKTDSDSDDYTNFDRFEPVDNFKPKNLRGNHQTTTTNKTWGDKNQKALNDHRGRNTTNKVGPEEADGETQVMQPGDLDLEHEIYSNHAFDAFDHPPIETDVTWLPPINPVKSKNKAVLLPLMLVKSNLNKAPKPSMTIKSNLNPVPKPSMTIRSNLNPVPKPSMTIRSNLVTAPKPLMTIRSNLTTVPNKILPPQTRPPANIPEFQSEDEMEDLWLDKTLASIRFNPNLTPKTNRPLQAQSPANISEFQSEDELEDSWLDKPLASLRSNPNLTPNVSELQSGDGNDLESVRKGKQPRPKEVSSTLLDKETGVDLEKISGRNIIRLTRGEKKRKNDEKSEKIDNIKSRLEEYETRNIPNDYFSDEDTAVGALLMLSSPYSSKPI
jgi:hypothetical protein